MKSLHNHTLLYDTDCPLCSTYTNAFIKTRLLDSTGRITYEKGVELYAGNIDQTRARNEIALVNTATGEVKYGIESLLFIISSGFPFLQKISQNKILIALLKKLYAFVSFNRKVIATSANYTKQTCVPDFNIYYRLLYILITALFTSTVLLKYSYMLKGLVPPSNMIREYMICFGQIVFQTVILLCIRSKKILVFDYVGNMMTVSLIGALLLLPMLLLNHLIVLSPLINLAFFFAVVLFMFLHHKRRVRNLQAPFWLSYTWVLYRCLVLLFIL